MSRLEFVSFLSLDKLKLPGLLYAPAKPSKKVAVWLHGMGDNGVFYKPELMNALGEALNNQGVALFTFNNRGAHNSKHLKIVDETLPEEDRGYPGGTHYEKIKDCVHDIEGARQYLEELGFSEFYLLGHSTGANKICAYHARQPQNKFSKYVLAGPGDDVGLFFSILGPKRFWLALRYAAKMNDKDPLRTMPKYTGMHPFSAQAAWDILNPDGAYNTFPYYEATTERLGSKPLFEEYRKINKRTLVIIGEDDEFAYPAGDAGGALKLFMEHSTNSQLKHTDFVSVVAADHSFHDREAEFAAKVSDWLAYG
ncbi:MAG TPA: alpha/beta fold hydrolase [Candidatus Saccharimonadales bacterium]|nr:alpha/beta fold hydrolase [Candidatus Saccharimonadales bacterium]